MRDDIKKLKKYMFIENLILFKLHTNVSSINQIFQNIHFLKRYKWCMYIKLFIILRALKTNFSNALITFDASRLF